MMDDIEDLLPLEDEDDLFLLFLLSCNNNNNKASFRSVLSVEARRRRDRRIPRIALLDPDVSPWVKLYVSGSQSAMITLTGLDYPSFHFLAA
jgi:hypothetical protein